MLRKSLFLLFVGAVLAPSLQAATNGTSSASVDGWNGSNPAFQPWQTTNSGGVNVISNGQWLLESTSGGYVNDTIARNFNGALNIGQTFSTTVFLSPVNEAGEEIDLLAPNSSGLGQELSLYTSGDSADSPLWLYIAQPGGTSQYINTGLSVTDAPNEQLNLSYTVLNSTQLQLNFSLNGQNYSLTDTGANPNITGVDYMLYVAYLDRPGDQLGVSQMSITTDPVPEPGVLSLVCVGMVAQGGWLAFKRRHRRSSSKAQPLLA